MLHFRLLDHCDITILQGPISYDQACGNYTAQGQDCTGFPLLPVRFFKVFLHDVCQVMYANFLTLQLLRYDVVHTSMQNTQFSYNFVYCGFTYMQAAIDESI